MVRYVSSRGGVPPCDFEQAVLDGLAADGGLYLPERWPHLDRDRLEALRGASYQEVAANVLGPFVEGALSETELRRLIDKAYAGFDHVTVAPLRQLDTNDWLLELFHGPTLAFKDIALQFLGHLFEHFLAKRGRSVTIVGATSGDTGAAAIEAFAGRERMTVVIEARPAFGQVEPAVGREAIQQGLLEIAQRHAAAAADIANHHRLRPSAGAPLVRPSH